MSIHKKLSYNMRAEASDFSLPICSFSDQSEALEMNIDQLVYHSYLENVFSELGIQFSPGGTSIVEVDDDLDIVDDNQRAIVGEDPSGTSSAGDSLLTYHHKDQHGAYKGAAPGLPSLIDSKQETQVDTLDKQFRKKKVKIYEAGPFEDEEREKRRINAINAKKNRDKTKRSIENLQKDVRSLKHVNNQCRKALLRTSADMQLLQQKMQQLRERLETETRRLRDKEKEVREKRERLALLKGHLEIIASGLDDDNPAKRLINHLVDRLPVDG
nr:uncharacterized protein LOC123757435 isoform X1 [Procambarus clarkii]XP_045596969.1 uncharacterized protein LOC123757435 isoform X1 [Procambarus clarkii]XP_045596970.1 uncharacterized protein LOC123757435 isoform X1 [Procambarus clarkii]